MDIIGDDTTEENGERREASGGRETQGGTTIGIIG
jgi:hypothetical protein